MLTAKVILFLRPCLTQQKAKFNKNLQVYISFADKKAKFWLGERPGRDLYFTCQLSFGRTSLLLQHWNCSVWEWGASAKRSMYRRKVMKELPNTHKVVPEFISFYPHPNHAVNTKTTGRISYDWTVAWGHLSSVPKYSTNFQTLLSSYKYTKENTVSFLALLLCPFSSYWEPAS